MGLGPARGAFGGAGGEPVAASGDGDDFGVVQEPVEDGAGGGHVVQELAPFLDGPVGGHADAHGDHDVSVTAQDALGKEPSSARDRARFVQRRDHFSDEYG